MFSLVVREGIRMWRGIIYKVWVQWGASETLLGFLIGPWKSYREFGAKSI